MDAHTLRMGNQTRRSRARKLGVEIAKLEIDIGPQLAALKKLKEEFDSLFDRPADEDEEEVPAPAPPKKRAYKRSGEPAPALIMKFFASNPGEQHLAVIEKGTGVNHATLLSALVLLTRQGKLQRARHAVYVPAVSNVTPLLGRRSSSDD